MGRILYQTRVSDNETATTREIYDWLAIGPAIHIPMMHSLGYRCLLIADECNEDVRFPGACEKIGIFDRGGNDPAKLNSIIDKLCGWHKDGSKIMVACGAGVSRAPTLTAGFLVRDKIFPQLMDALIFLKQERPEMGPNFGIVGDVYKLVHTLPTKR